MLMPDTCVILAPTNANDGAGHMVATYAPIAAGTVPCRVDQIRSNQIISGAIYLINEMHITVPYNAPLDESYRISYATRIYKITGFVMAKSWQIVNDLTVEEAV